MKLKIIEEKKKKIVFEIEEADHTLLNLLKEQLNNMEDVNIATYNIEHPLLKKGKFILEAKNPRETFNKAIDKIKNELNTFKRHIEKLEK